MLSTLPPHLCGAPSVSDINLSGCWSFSASLAFVNKDGGCYSELTSVGGRLFAISLDLHAARDTGVRLSAGQIGNVNESVVERSLDVANTEDVLGVLAGRGLGRAVVSDLLFLLLVGSLLCSLRLNTENRASS